PSGWVTPGGKVLIFANAAVFGRKRLNPNIIAVEDNRGVLSERWRCVLDVMSGDFIGSAPAPDMDSRMLLVTTMNNLFVFRNVDALAGRVPSPIPFFGEELIGFRAGIRRRTVKVGSPFALTYHPDTSEIVTYTNLRVIPSFGYRTYGFLSSFALPT